jgi:hypothetical protein
LFGSTDKNEIGYPDLGFQNFIKIKLKKNPFLVPVCTTFLLTFVFIPSFDKTGPVPAVCVIDG